ncbi:hypothetical protein [Phaeobacter phage MD18]|nr:hypothetical protein [Phaeobacter phage MD18]
MSDVVFPIGKFSGELVTDVAMASPGYLSWWTAQPNLVEDHPKVAEEIARLNGGADTSPEHNKIQSAFLDGEFVSHALSPVLDELAIPPEEKIANLVNEINETAENGRALYYDQKSDIGSFNGRSLERTLKYMSPDTGKVWVKADGTKVPTPDGPPDEDLYLFTVATYSLYVTRDFDPKDNPFEEKCEPTAFESFCDVTIEWDWTSSITVRRSIREVTLTKYKRYAWWEARQTGYSHFGYPEGSIKELPDEIVEIELEDLEHVIEAKARATLAMELKPTIGDEYPKIMRQMAGQKKFSSVSDRRGYVGKCPWDRHILYTRSNVSSLSDDVLRKMFATNGIDLIIDGKSKLPA